MQRRLERLLLEREMNERCIENLSREEAALLEELESRLQEPGMTPYPCLSRRYLKYFSSILTPIVRPGPTDSEEDAFVNPEWLDVVLSEVDEPRGRSEINWLCNYVYSTFPERPDPESYYTHFYELYSYRQRNPRVHTAAQWRNIVRVYSLTAAKLFKEAGVQMQTDKVLERYISFYSEPKKNAAKRVCRRLDSGDEPAPAPLKREPTLS